MLNNVLEIEASRTLSDPAGSKSSARSVRSASVEWCTCAIPLVSFLSSVWNAVHALFPTHLGKQCRISPRRWQGKGSMADDRKLRSRRRLNQPVWKQKPVRSTVQFTLFCAGRSVLLTCVPPSPGKVLYHRDLCGPEMGLWSWPWLPWAIAQPAHANSAKGLRSMLIIPPQSSGKRGACKFAEGGGKREARGKGKRPKKKKSFSNKQKHPAHRVIKYS